MPQCLVICRKFYLDSDIPSYSSDIIPPNFDILFGAHDIVRVSVVGSR